MTVRGGEAMDAKRAAAQGARSEMPRPLLRGKPKRRGPMTGRAVSPQAKCDRTGARAGAGTGSRVWEKRKAPRCRGDDYESPTAYFLSIKKVGKER